MAEKTCQNCAHYGESGDGEPGVCLWAQSMPPAMKELLSALTADPSTMISYSLFGDVEVEVSPDHCCASHSGHPQ